MSRNSVGHTIRIAVLLCLVCSFLVSAAAVGLRNRQNANRDRERKKNILVAAGLYDDETNSIDQVDAIYNAHVDARLINLEDESRPFVDPDSVPELGTSPYNQKKAAADPDLSKPVPPGEDVASVKRRERYSWVYLIRDAEGTLTQVVVPVRGYGLWSTLWGFLAIDYDSLHKGPEHAEIRYLTFYEQKETPGLGGEVDNPAWKAQWNGIHIYDENGDVETAVVKSKTNPEYQVDAISGATITSNGVTNMMKYWLGKNGFGPFLKRLSKEGDPGPSHEKEQTTAAK